MDNNDGLNIVIAVGRPKEGVKLRVSSHINHAEWNAKTGAVKACEPVHVNINFKRDLTYGAITKSIDSWTPALSPVDTGMIKHIIDIILRRLSNKYE